MKNSDVKIGMKVVPHDKTVEGYGDGLNESNQWSVAKENNQPFMYVTEWSDDENCWCLSADNIPNTYNADFFDASDFELYREARYFRFDGYLGQGKKDFSGGEWVIGKIYPAQDFEYYEGTDLEPDADFLDDEGNWWTQNLCFFTEVFDSEYFGNEPSPLEMAIMNASALELEVQFTGE